MVFTWPRLLTVLNIGALFVSLALIGLSPAILYLTSHGMRLMDKAYPQGYYEWYRGPSNDIDTKHKVKLMYESTNEYMIFTAAAVSVLAGLVGVVGFLMTRKISKPTTQNPTIYLLVLPGSVSFIVTLVTFLFTQIVYDTDNKGKCYWEKGYNPYNVFRCTREQAACNIVSYFTRDDSKLQQIFDTLRGACGETQTGRHLVAPLFVASGLMLGLTVAQFLVEKRENRFVETADERVDRLERQEG